MLAALAVTAILERFLLERFHRSRAGDELLAQARLAAAEMARAPDEPSTFRNLCRDIGRAAQSRVTLILPDGRVAGDSEKDPAEMENHRGRPEVDAALAGRESRASRHSASLGKTMLYAAAPLRGADGGIRAAVRMSRALQAIRADLSELYARAAVALLAAAAVGACVGWVIARRIAAPVAAIRSAAERVSAGDLTARAAVPAASELSSLAAAINSMADQLTGRLDTITRQRDEQRAVLCAMGEGVLAVDAEQSVVLVNDAAARMLDMDAQTARGRPLLEVARSADLLGFVTDVLAAGAGAREREITAGSGAEERLLRLLGTPLNGNGGALVVMEDVTRVRRMEETRRDFVANVSHELKTPIAAIMGSLETLESGAAERAGEAPKFTASAARQARRLQAIVEDLLSLARIEHDAERGTLAVSPGSVAEVLERVRQTFAVRAGEKGVEIAVECPPELAATMNAALIEEAVGNLVDNAIKYGPAGAPVLVQARLLGGEVDIAVRDRGPGIERKHLPRVFERFYRVDQARSRALGGTGLGLAIVKHIALAHRGSVAVESTAGEGSTFRIRLPPA
jgi:two-component system phosphate regulon sensor histidine kinase PhoR